MSLGRHWAQRLAKRRVILDEKVEEKRARGKMAHWSLVKMRLTVEGKPMPQSHILRPEFVNSAPTTMCGWHEASFKVARRYGFPTATLWPAGISPLTACGLEPRIGCPICCDVLHDIATWIELGKMGDKEETAPIGGVHLAWCRSDPLSACGKRSVILASPTDVAKNTMLHCPACKAIHGRVWGDERPEAQFLTYMTNEEAAKIIEGV